MKSQPVGLLERYELGQEDELKQTYSLHDILCDLIPGPLARAMFKHPFRVRAFQAAALLGKNKAMFKHPFRVRAFYFFLLH